MTAAPHSSIVPQLVSIADEWDLAGPIRHDLIAKGLDTSFHSIFVPTVKKFLDQFQPKTILDAGCGTGDLTREISHHAGDILAVDISRRSIELARELNSAPNISYRCASIENLAQTASMKFDSIVCNMVLMDTPKLSEVLSAIHRLSGRNAKACFTIFHPPFWFESHRAQFPHRKYCEEFHVRLRFETRLARKNDAICTHFHRPIQVYFEEFSACGFSVLELNELCIPREIEHLYGAESDRARFVAFTVEAK